MRFILTESSCCRMLEQDSCLVGCCCSYCCSFLCFFAKLCFILRECTNISVSRKHTFTICLLVIRFARSSGDPPWGQSLLQRAIGHATAAHAADRPKLEQHRREAGWSLLLDEKLQFLRIEIRVLRVIQPCRTSREFKASVDSALGECI